MKKLNKKGFTITELVIVISVIAILSAVMIPTFGGMIAKSKDSAAVQDAKNAYTVYLSEADYSTTDTVADDFVYTYDTTRFVAIKDGKIVDVYETKLAAVNAALADGDTDATAETLTTYVTATANTKLESVKAPAQQNNG